MSDNGNEWTEGAETPFRIVIIKATFPIGQLVATPGALAAIEAAGQLVEEFLCRHAVGDWGELDVEDVIANNRAVEGGYRILSAYSTANTDKVWIITEANRSYTTILLPSEY